ncbi:hypothetical protein [Sphingomonas sp. J315]|uniref:hypothetical protein n=1 Tax=Sphingomonas sp. J315 TaxID=2898433 RepID=UPI0021AD59B7|nr:hypothetical protein [Sphingomonas sp. J315]UUX98135.1 hypothetical protein LRS08_10955 [Sphingomonas sp. J315]
MRDAIRASAALLLAFAALVLGTPAVRADSWGPPQPASYSSANGSFRLNVTPRKLRGQLGYFEDKVAGKEPAGQAKGETATTASAVLERRDAAGKWTRVWAAPLVNEVAPTHALVADDGRHVVTFDNWHSVGFGPDVVVIYGADGRRIRSLGLTDLLPPAYIRALPHSVSSIWWGGTHRLSPDGARAILAIVVPEQEPFAGAKEHVEIEIDLASGTPVEPSGAAWERALAKALAVAKAYDAADAERRAAFLAPLVGPANPDEQDWHDYLREAYYRIDPDWEEGFPATAVLQDPRARDYKQSVKWLHDELKGQALLASGLSLATLAPPEHFLLELEKAARAIKAGAAAGARIYVAISAAWKDRVAAALAPTGAIFIHLDPAVPIPQRPERLEKLRKAEAEAAAEGA